MSIYHPDRAEGSEEGKVGNIEISSSSVVLGMSVPVSLTSNSSGFCAIFAVDKPEATDSD